MSLQCWRYFVIVIHYNHLAILTVCDAAMFYLAHSIGPLIHFSQGWVSTVCDAAMFYLAHSIGPLIHFSQGWVRF